MVFLVSGYSFGSTFLNHHLYALLGFVHLVVFVYNMHSLLYGMTRCAGKFFAGIVVIRNNSLSSTNFVVFTQWKYFDYIWVSNKGPTSILCFSTPRGELYDFCFFIAVVFHWAECCLLVVLPRCCVQLLAICIILLKHFCNALSRFLCAS